MSPVSRLLLRSCAVVAALGASMSARAIDICVDSPALLSSALLLGQFQGAPYRINLVQGTYTMTDSMVAELSAPTIIAGGYTAGCGTRISDATNTIIDIGQGRELKLSQKSSSPQAQLTLDGMTLRNTNHPIQLEAGEYQPVGSSDGGSLTLRRVRFTKVNANYTFAIRLSVDEERMMLENVQVDHVSATGSCGIWLSALDSAVIDINHATFELAGGDNVCLHDHDDATHMRIYNSIIWSSSSASLIGGSLEEDTQVAIVNTIFQQHVLDAQVSVVGHINASPRFIDAPGGNYRLSANPLSPAINTGTLVTPFGVPATDIEGRIRLAGLMPDRGAYESSVSSHDTLVVSNTNDNGLGSLRQAMIEANATSSAKTIQFNIRNGAGVPVCPAVIALSTPLPKIVAPMTIDGRTQPLSGPNTAAEAFNATLCVAVKPAAATLASGFHVGVTAVDGSLALYGLALGGFGQPVMLLGGHDHVIAGNQFGGQLPGVALPGATQNAIAIGASAGGSVRIGGTVADRNVIGGAAMAGINIQNDVATTPERCVILNNLIGLSPSGTAPNPNNVGINAGGGACLIKSNRISGNSATNLWINSSDAHRVQANVIGPTLNDATLLNQAVGILISGYSSYNIIGSTNGAVADRNTISFNKVGIVVEGNFAGSNTIRVNRIDRNGFTGDAMDIDLRTGAGDVGPTGNDASDLDSGGNAMQNFPEPWGIDYLQGDTGSGPRAATIHALLESMPETYRVDAYFSDTASNGRGHMQTHVGTSSINVGDSGSVSWSVSIVLPVRTPGFVSLVATNQSGSTSEVGPAVAVNEELFSDEFE